ncbi:putative lanthionine synthetase C-like protein [Actinacidiphila reveromycinica]|uniref:Putative lanthionine synthetase C-like protein n=1 Tax=Actinacidiphila reveromycinica TaxID=659352 RepID=A0A7U3UUX3_9ACTN|nr:lanthionine synthetase C family protein [Streptomyces sp. SN-593]BBA99051.1 putative lanthionine synthetase C-like protein [Streptomyces sp. SN-593]
MTAPASTTVSAADLLQQFTALVNEARPQPPKPPDAGQSLAVGAAGTALLFVERAWHDQPWRPAHRLIAEATAGEVNAGDTGGLFLGATAVAFLLSATPHDREHLYADARATLHRQVTALAHRRADAADQRLRAGEPLAFADYDLFYGLTGIGAYLLRTDPGSSALGRVLAYLVALTRPRTLNGSDLPGWWVHHDPLRAHSDHFPGGHANLGTAHGITGPLLLLAKALRTGIKVEGHRTAIRIICDFLDTWRQDAPEGPWWPTYLSYEDVQRRRPGQDRPGRPSWCYGTTGIARAGQLAGISLGDTTRQALYEDALYRALTAPAQLRVVVDAGLCHGWAGIYQTVVRATDDSNDPRLPGLRHQLAVALITHARPNTAKGRGLLEGAAGTALALSTLAHSKPPDNGWDACLLIN